mgnify:CR=1 FL=1
MYGARLSFYPQPYGGVEFGWTHTGADVTVNSVYNGFVPGGALGRIDYDAYDINFVGRSAQLRQPQGHGIRHDRLRLDGDAPELVTSPTATLGSNTLVRHQLRHGRQRDHEPEVGPPARGPLEDHRQRVTTGTYTYCDYWGYCYGYSSSSYNIR